MINGCDPITEWNATRRITTPTDRSFEDGGWWGRRQRVNRSLVQQGGWDVVFIGDSITQGWEGAGAEFWNRYYAPRRALNLGYSGDRIEHALWRLDNGETSGPAPKLAIVLIGTNNTGYRLDPPSAIASGISTLIERLQKSWPTTPILLLGLLPRGESPDDPRRTNNANTNRLLAGLADQRQVFFLDIGAGFVEADGRISPSVMPDFLHLSANGYRIWAESMEPTLDRLLGEASPATTGTPGS